jgi:hypothetical protein
MREKIKPLPTNKEAEIPLYLIEEIRKSSALLLVGSGLSVPLKYPSWEKLIEQIYNRIESSSSAKDAANEQWMLNNSSAQPDWVAEVITSASRNEFYNAIRDIFLANDCKEISINHILMALLSFKGYLTTNYDTLIEDYLSIFSFIRPDVYDYAESLENYARFKLLSRYVLKLHGCIRKNADRIILTASDYYRLLHDQRYIRLLASIFSESTILSIGFSLRDRDFRFFLEERYHLYGARCPPLYAVIPYDETCPLETALLRDKYNVHIIPISESDNYIELTSFLFSLYCIVHREDSSVIGNNFLDIAIFRVQDTGEYKVTPTVTEPVEIISAKAILSVFKDPIDVDVLIAVCFENGINLSSATCMAMADILPDKRVSLKKPISVITEDNRRVVASWISSELESIPITESPRHLTSYHKSIFGKYANTISYLLKYKEGWEEILGNDAESPNKLTRICQFFKQEGMWKQWLEIANNAQSFIEDRSLLYKPLMQSVLWVYFWTRRYNDAQKLLERIPWLDEKKGEHNYTDRILYMRKDYTKELINKLSKKKDIDYFDISLLGRAYARLYLMEDKDKNHLIKAKEYLSKALEKATESGDWIEMSVQSWYLAIVLSDLGEINDARVHLSEVRRLDENIMSRVPGLAWLDLAEYRMSFNDSTISNFMRSELRKKVVASFNALGTVDIEQYIDNEYYY